MKMRHKFPDVHASLRLLDEMRMKVNPGYKLTHYGYYFFTHPVNMKMKQECHLKVYNNLPYKNNFTRISQHISVSVGT